MTTVAISASPANTDDRHLARVHAALLHVFDLDPSEWTAPVAAIPCPPCEETPWQLYAGDDEDRSAREAEPRRHTDEDEWFLGWTLGHAGIEAEPTERLSGHGRRAFWAGHEQGRRELEHEDRLAWAEKWDRETIAAMMADPDIESRYENAELAELGIQRKAV